MGRLYLLGIFQIFSFFVSISQGNPFDVISYYVNPSYQAELQGSIDTLSPDDSSLPVLEQMLSVPSAYWIDTKSKIEGSDTNCVEGILADALGYDDPPLVVFIVYNAPNRDCDANASNGEICCTYNNDGTCDFEAGGDCSNGLAEYNDDYIIPFAQVLSKYDGLVPIVLVIEPDTLPNLATNLDNPRCGDNATTTSYLTAVPLAVNTFASACPSCSIYCDAAHGGWLGWPNNLKAFVSIISEMNIVTKLRGFTTNSANYQPLGSECALTSATCATFTSLPKDFDAVIPKGSHPVLPTNHMQLSPSEDVLSAQDPCCDDPCGLLEEGNPANNELNYVYYLNAALIESIPGFSPHFVIDTGRNGVTNERSSCSNWCNIRGAGIGVKPTIETGDIALVDAYYWLKTPGESDGCTQYLPADSDAYSQGSACPRFDVMCASSDSIGSESSEPYAPEAGFWFDFQIKSLAQNAVWS